MRFRLAILTLCLLFFIFVGASMATYRGSSAFLPDDLGYSFYNNFFSDLGLTQGYNHIPLGAFTRLTFGIGLIAAAGAASLFFQSMATRLSQRSARYAQAFGNFGAFLLLLIPFLPSDLFLWPHRFAFIGAIISIATASLPIALSLPRKGWQHVAFRSMNLLTFAYIAFLFLAPTPAEGLEPRLIHAVAQKFIAIGLIGALAAQSAWPAKN